MKSSAKALAVVLGLIGVVFVIQGFGLATTGSTMDDQAFWGFVGIGLLVAAAGIGMRGRSRAGETHEDTPSDGHSPDPNHAPPDSGS